jgi:transporter family-2 protein
VFTTLGGDNLGKFPTSPWWVYLGGAIGILYIAFASTIVQEIGVLAFTLFTTGGQLIGSLLIDLIFPTEGVAIGPNLIIGIALSYAGVLRPKDQLGRNLFHRTEIIDPPIKNAARA